MKMKCIAASILLLSIFVILACQIISPSESTQPEIHRVAIYGDSHSGNGDNIHQQIVNLIMEKNPHAVFLAGDIVDDGNNPNHWLVFENTTSDLQDSSEFYPCLGNHDFESAFYFVYFGIPRTMRWYSVNRFGLHFVVLDSNFDLDTGSDQYNWLVNDLADSEGDFNVVIMHHPIYSVTRDIALYTELETALVPLFQQNNVRIVFSGHEHNYERFYDAGIYYIVTGGGGGSLRHKTKDDPRLQVFIMKHHYCFLTYDGENLLVKVYDGHDDLIDQFSVNTN